MRPSHKVIIEWAHGCGCEFRYLVGTHGTYRLRSARMSCIFTLTLFFAARYWAVEYKRNGGRKLTPINPINIIPPPFLRKVIIFGSPALCLGCEVSCGTDSFRPQFAGKVGWGAMDRSTEIDALFSQHSSLQTKTVCRPRWTQSLSSSYYPNLRDFFTFTSSLFTHFRVRVSV